MSALAIWCGIDRAEMIARWTDAIRSGESAWTSLIGRTADKHPRRRATLPLARSSQPGVRSSRRAEAATTGGT